MNRNMKSNFAFDACDAMRQRYRWVYGSVVPYTGIILSFFTSTHFSVNDRGFQTWLTITNQGTNYLVSCFELKEGRVCANMFRERNSNCP